MKRFFQFLLTVVILSLFISQSFSVFAATTYTFGVKVPDDPSYTTSPIDPLGAQGKNNFYFYYAVEHKVNAKINLANIKECEYGVVNGSGYGNLAKKYMQPQKADMDYYKNTVFPSRYPGQAPQVWFRIDAYGYVCPSGDMTSVVYFKAPEAGTYEIVAEHHGGSRSDIPTTPTIGDGVTFAIFDKTTSNNLYTKNTGRNFDTYRTVVSVPKKTVQLAKDEKVYFVADPNDGFEYDWAHWYLNITMTAAAATPTPASSVASVSEVSSSSSSESISESISVSESATVSDSSSQSSSTAPTGTRGSWIYYVIAGVVVLLGGGAAAYYFIFVKAKK